MLIKIKAFPGSKKEEIIKKSDDSFEVKIKEKAEKGRANKKIMEILASYFKTKKIKLIKGGKTKNKIIKIG